MAFKKNITGWKAFLLIVPIMLALFPIPLAIPVLLCSLVSVHHENWPLPVFYFIWLVLSVVVIWKTERNGYWVG